MNTDPHVLAARIGASLRRDIGNPMFRPLVNLLAAGRPVAVEDLIQATGIPAEDVRQDLAGLKDIEYNRAGKIVGQGITLRPTRHRFEVDGRQLYLWCALDTLLFSIILGRPARGSSPCRATGSPVEVTVEPTRLRRVEPASAVLSIVTPESPASIRAAFCENVHYFVSDDAARDWLSGHPNAELLSVADAFAVSRLIFAE